MPHSFSRADLWCAVVCVHHLLLSMSIHLDVWALLLKCKKKKTKKKPFHVHTVQACHCISCRETILTPSCVVIRVIVFPFHGISSASCEGQGQFVPSDQVVLNVFSESMWIMVIRRHYNGSIHPRQRFDIRQDDKTLMDKEASHQDSVCYVQAWQHGNISIQNEYIYYFYNIS